MHTHALRHCCLGWWASVVAIIFSANVFGAEASRPPAPQPYLVKDITPGLASTALGPPLALPGVSANRRIYFRAADSASGSELWTSDGTSEGTVLAADIVPGLDGSAPGNLTFFNARLYFTATTAVRRRLIRLQAWRRTSS